MHNLTICRAIETTIHAVNCASMVEKWISSFGSEVQKFQLQEAEEAYQAAKDQIYSCAADYELEVQSYHSSPFFMSAQEHYARRPRN